MCSSSIPLTELTLKVVRKAYMYHKITDYDHIIAYARFAFIVINVKEMINYLATIELWHAKRYFNIMSSTIHARGCAVLYSIEKHLAFKILSM